ncbi:MAG: ATP-binding protein [Methanomethylovorans sp.]|uniref:ATP-binding protein n=1 Tax=Methanomethylovorans sp. TaxID=2758717 RepID=UPI000A7480B9|nr:ATP-binding protein [Methanomethylovorans sp.]
MKGSRILIVEDERITALDIKYRLEDSGYVVTGIVSSGKAAIESAEETKPDLVLMDIMIEGDMDGTQAALHIRNRFHIPVIFLTAYADKDTVRKAKIAEPFGYILKPFENKDLQTNIEIALYKHRAEQELRDKEAWVSAILKNMADAVIATDVTGTIRHLNPTAEILTGWKGSEAIGKPLVKVFQLSTANGEMITNLISNVLESGIFKGDDNEDLFLSRGHIKVPVSVTGTSIMNDGNDVIGLVYVFKDLTVLRQEKEALLNAKLSAEAANSSKSEFLANISHELRTPLTSIIGFSDLLLEETFGAINEKQHKYLQNVSSSGKHLLDLINNILDISKAEAGKMQISYEYFNVFEAINEINTITVPLALKKDISLDIRIDPQMNNIRADRLKFRQIMYNLTSNAIKFTNHRGHVSIEGKLSGNLAQFRVKDDGIGIAKKDQPKIFNSFTQVDSSVTRRYEGTGLGLFLVKKFVELHGGHVWVESEPGKGSVFSFILPYDGVPFSEK